MEENLAANSRDFATPEGAANNGENAPLPVETAPLGPDTAPATGPQIPEKAEGREWTRKVAQRIKEERQKAQSELITELFGNEEACTEYRERREREVAAEADQEEAALFAELALATDPDLGEHYLALADEVQALAQTYGADVESAFLVVLSQQLPRLLREERAKAEQELLARLSQSALTPGALAATAAAPAGLSSLNDKEFAALVARVKLEGRT